MNDQLTAMPDEPLSQEAPEETVIVWGTLVGLAIGLVAVGALFHTEIATGVRTWYISTAYNHCFLVIPIAAWLAWDRRASLQGLAPAAMPLAALLAVPLAVAWLAAERLGIMEGRQLVMITLVQVLFLALLGRRLYLALLGPLLYLYFLVPFGEFLTPKLQDVTTWFTREGLNVLGIPAYIDGYIIEIKEGTFFVAEACAGLRFLIAAVAFGVLYSLMMYRSPMRRIVFITASIIVPIIANGFRALGIVYLGHLLGSAEAAATDHILYGWIFFSLVILVLIALGLPFREDGNREPENPSPMEAEPDAMRRGVMAGLAVAILAAVGPAIGMGLNQASAAPVLVPKALVLPASCLTAGAPEATAASPLGRATVQHVYCGGTSLNILIETFSPRTTAGPVTAERRRLTRIPDADDISEAPVPAEDGAPLRGWRLVRSNDPAAVSAVGLWIDGAPAAPGLATRLRLAQTSVTGAEYAPVIVTITPTIDWAHAHVTMRQKDELETSITDLLHRYSEIGDQVKEAARAAAR